MNMTGPRAAAEAGFSGRAACFSARSSPFATGAALRASSEHPLPCRDAAVLPC